MRTTGFAIALLALAAAVACRSVDKNEAGIRNYVRIDDTAGRAGSTVGFGGATPPSAMPWLRGEGFASVVCLRDSDEKGVDVAAAREAAKNAGLAYYHLPFDPKDPDPQLLGRFFAAVERRPNQPVYIYCSSGNRAGAMWMVQRALRDGWPVDRARAEAKRAGLSKPGAEKFAVAAIEAKR